MNVLEKLKLLRHALDLAGVRDPTHVLLPFFDRRRFASIFEYAACLEFDYVPWAVSEHGARDMGIDALSADKKEAVQIKWYVYTRLTADKLGTFAMTARRLCCDKLCVVVPPQHTGDLSSTLSSSYNIDVKVLSDEQLQHWVERALQLYVDEDLGDGSTSCASTTTTQSVLRECTPPPPQQQEEEEDDDDDDDDGVQERVVSAPDVPNFVDSGWQEPYPHPQPICQEEKVESVLAPLPPPEPEQQQQVVVVCKKTMPKLWRHQEEAAQVIVVAYDRDACRRAVDNYVSLCMPCGTGKTRAYLHALQQIVKKRASAAAASVSSDLGPPRCRTYAIIVPTLYLVDQTMLAARDAGFEHIISVYGGVSEREIYLAYRQHRIDADKYERDTVLLYVSTWHSAYKLNRCHLEVAVLDEAHHVYDTFETATRTQEDVPSSAVDTHKLSCDIRRLGAHFYVLISASMDDDKMDYVYSVQDAVRERILSPFQVQLVPIAPNTDLFKMAAPRVATYMRGQIEAGQMGKRIMVFCQTRQQADLLQAAYQHAFTGTNVFVQVIDQHVPPSRRMEVLQQAGMLALVEAAAAAEETTANDISIIISMFTLGEGFDAPNVDVVACFQPNTPTKRVLQQRIGRALRYKENKTASVLVVVSAAKAQETSRVLAEIGASAQQTVMLGD